jgi:hypothetical protein
MSNENLWQEFQEKEREDDARYRQRLGNREIQKFTPKSVDYDAAIKRFNDEIAPVFAMRKKALRSKVLRERLRKSGDLAALYLDPKEIVNPTKGLVCIGPTEQDIIKKIRKNPKLVTRSRLRIPQVSRVVAERRTIEPRLADEPRDDDD